MSQPNSPSAVIIDAVVIDANVLIGICTKETKEQTARTALASYITRKWKFYAPNAIIPEFLHIACKKVDEGKLTVAEYEKAVEDFNDYMDVIFTPPNGDAPLIKRASEIRQGYGCSRSSDSLYVALAEELSKHGSIELLTFDAGLVNQAAKNAPSVKIHLLPS
ncbi:MAG: type II toxin-antitoxin system VapC family toxin [Acidobacteria bacterium]|nr:type II toxin-antitoxin system VapC family toxin [Acidobacteriota bacterium]